MKNESVHCVLLGASSLEQIQENILALQVSCASHDRLLYAKALYFGFPFRLQVVPKLTPTVMNDIERILGNKPISRQPSKSENLQKA